MAVKVFIRDIEKVDYVSVPADGFRLQGTYLLTQSAGGDPAGIGPLTAEQSFVFTFPLNSSPQGVYQALYSLILSDCATNGWEVPTPTDIYGWIPLSFDMLGVQ